MSVSDIADWPTSHLDAADAAFAALTCEPAPLSLDCSRLTADAGVDLALPGGVVTLPALRVWLLNNPHNYPARDAVWRELILRARLAGPTWVIAAAGMAMPALVRLARQLAVGYRGEACDMDSEVLTGFLEALRDHADLSRPAPYASLVMAAFRAGLRLRRGQDTAVAVDDIEAFAAGPRAPKAPYGHPDLLVERAGTLGLLDPADVGPWIEVRLGRRAPEPIAVRLGITVDALRMRLNRADERIAQALAEGVLTGVLSAEAGRRLAQRADTSGKVRAGKAAHATGTARACAANRFTPGADQPALAAMAA